MKKFTLILLASLLAFSAVSCKGKDGAAKKGGKERIRVVTFFAGSDQWAPVWKQVIAEYMQAHPNVEIIDESQPTAGSNDLFRTKIQTDISAKTPADLILFYDGGDGEIILDSGLYVDWNSYMKADTAWSKNLKPGPMEAGQKNGVQYCIPYIGYYEGLFYNKALFDKFGLKEPTTYQAILDSIPVFVKNGIVPIGAPIGRGAGYLIEAMILAQVGAAGQKNYFDDSWAPALDAIADLYQRGAFSKDSMTVNDEDLRVMFKDGKSAMMVNGSWCTNAIKDQDGMRIIAFPTLPGGKGGEKTTVAGFGSGWYMSKEAAKRSDETLKLTKFLTSPETISRFIAVGGSSAIICDVPEGSSAVEKAAAEMLNKAAETRPAVDSQVIREAWLKIAQDGLPYLVEKKATAKELLKNARAVQAEAN